MSKRKRKPLIHTHIPKKDPVLSIKQGNLKEWRDTLLEIGQERLLPEPQTDDNEPQDELDPPLVNYLKKFKPSDWPKKVSRR